MNHESEINIYTIIVLQKSLRESIPLIVIGILLGAYTRQQTRNLVAVQIILLFIVVLNKGLFCIS